MIRMRQIVWGSVAVVAVAASAAAIHVGAQQQELPRFRTSVELTSIDISVLDRNGEPIIDLKPEEFSVKVDGAARKVVSAQWVPLAAPETTVAGVVPPEGYSSNENATSGRLILIVVDELNIRVGGTLGIRNAINTFIDRLEPSDRAAVVGIGQSAPSTPFTPDRKVLKNAILRLVGQKQTFSISRRNISLTETIDIRNDAPGALDNVINRECGGIRSPGEMQICASEVESDARSIAQQGLFDGEQTVKAMRSLLVALRRIDAPKTLLFVSEGFLTGDQQSSIAEFGALAAAARTSIYTLKLDDSLFVTSAETRSAPISPFQDRQLRAEGLEQMASAARGSLFNIVGNGSGVFERIESELSGYYLLGVESVPTDKDGKPHPIRVEVSRRSATIRSRRALMTMPDEAKPRNQREAVMAALATPLPISGLPIRVATFSLKGPEVDKLQLLIHADLGTDYAASRVVAIAYTITDKDGRIVESLGANARLLPIMTGVPSALQFSGGASLVPGDYSLKLAFAEGDRVGTIEHAIHASLADSGGVKFSDLMVGGPPFDQLEPLQPSVGYTAVFGTVHGYVEAYGSGVARLKATYEIATDEDGEALAAEEIATRTAGDSRAIFTRVMPVRRLPPGRYFLRAKISSGDAPVKTLTRAFEVAAPAVLMTSATTGSVAPVADVYLPVSDVAMLRQFDRKELARGETLQTFRNRVPASVRTAFDRGVEYLSDGEYSKAEASFKSAIDPDTDSTAVLAYLAAAYAAAGRDRDAAGAWQTALVDGSDLPEIYQWLGDALMRAHDLSQARAVLEEAVEKWPADVRFTKTMAMMYATFGQGREAVRTLERYLEERPADIDATFMGIEWIYNLHTAGAVAHTPAEDRMLARKYADAYINAKGPQTALVKQWLDFVAKQ